MAMKIDDYISSGTATNNAMAQRRAQDSATWERMLKQINQTTPQTMLGYGLGKLLRGAWDHSKRRAAQKEEEARRQRDQLGRNSARRAGIAPVKGVLGDGFNVGEGFQAITGGNNPIAWEAYGQAIRAQQPSAESPVVAKTTEYVYDPNKYSAVQMSLPERAAQIQQANNQPMNIMDWWNNQLSREYLNQGRQG